MLKNKGRILLLIVFLIAVNWLATLWHTRLDLTAEKRFTLSKPVKKILTSIDAPVTIDVFLKGNYPSGFKKLGNSAGDILNEFRQLAGNKLQYRFISPNDIFPGTDITYGDTLTGMGLFPINLTSQLKEGQQQQLVFPFALVHCKDTVVPVTLYRGKTPLIDYGELNSAEAMLEFQFANAISRLTRKEKPVVAFVTGNGEPMDLSVYDLVENVLRTEYNLVTFNLASQPGIPLEIKTLVLVKPAVPFTEIQKLKLDQYVMNGGRILFFIDRLNAEMDSLQIRNEVIAYDRDLKINDLLFKYGVRINPDLVMDLQCDYLPFDVNGNGQFELLPWNYFPVLEETDHPITRNLGFVAGRFVNSIDTLETENILKSVLLTTSENSRTIQTPALISGRENVNAAQDEKYKKKNIPVAVLLEGTFPSLYANRLSAEMSDTLKTTGSSFLSHSFKDAKIIVVSDGDMILNSVIKNNEPIAMGINPYTFGSQREFPFANKSFLINCLEYLTDESGLSEAKNKDYKVRLLDSKKVNSEILKWQFLNIALPVCLVLLFAFLFHFIRRHKYR